MIQYQLYRLDIFYADEAIYQHTADGTDASKPDVASFHPFRNLISKLYIAQRHQRLKEAKMSHYFFYLVYQRFFGVGSQW